MINYKDIEQQTEEWFKIKWGRIGGTLSTGLFIKSDTLMIDIASQRMEEFELSESFSNDAMDRGNELEPEARAYLNEYTGLDFLVSGWLQCEENELLGISPDGLTLDEKIGCEIKCLGRKAHYSLLLSGEIEKQKLCQILQMFTVNPKLEKHYFIAYRQEAPNHFIKIFTRDSVINLGTKARPVEKTISDWVEIAKIEADKLLKEIIEFEQSLKF